MGSSLLKLHHLNVVPALRTPLSSRLQRLMLGSVGRMCVAWLVEYLPSVPDEQGSRPWKLGAMADTCHPSTGEGTHEFKVIPCYIVGGQTELHKTILMFSSPTPRRKRKDC